MKKHILLGAALLSLFATSCSNDDVINNDSETQEGQTISLQANIADEADTRMAYVDDVAKKVLKFSWSDKESFLLYKGTGSTATTFSKTANGNIFTGSIPGGGSDTYYAVYGNNITNNNGVLDVNIANQTGSASAVNGITTFMLAQAKYLTQASGMTPTLDFQHKLGVMKLSLALPDGVTGKVSKITISGLNNKARYTLRTNTYSNETKGDITVTNGSNGFAITGNKITAYVAVFPENVSDNQVTIKAYVGDNEYYFTIAGARTLQEGKVVPVNVTLTKRNFKSVYTEEDYKTWSEDNCGSAPTYNDMCKYLGAGVYWDKGAAGANQQTYTLPNGGTYHTGLWVMKKAYIGSGVTATSSTITSKGLFKIGRPADINKYFFLPAAGYYYNGNFIAAGSFGYYWSSSRYDDDNDIVLVFSVSKAEVHFTNLRGKVNLPMVAE